MRVRKYSIKQHHIGPTGQKILLLLFAGATLALSTRPDVSLRVLKTIPEAWKDIDRNALQKSVKRLHKSGFVRMCRKSDGDFILALTKEGGRRAANYNLGAINIAKPSRWDGLWRVVMFDVPEQYRNGRNALVKKLKELGFISIQKSVFILPYECRNEISFIVEAYELSPYVKFLVAKELDGESKLRQHFNI